MPDALRIEESAPAGMITLKGDLDLAALAAAVERTTGAPVPHVRRFTLGERGRALWMAPDELLLIVPQGEVAAAIAVIAEALQGEHHLAADVSDARVRFLIAGPGAREVLAKGAPVDLAPQAFGPGDLRRTRVGQVAAAFWCTAPEEFELVCFRSVATYMHDWLATAARPGGQVGFFGT
ncbi:MAG TPA: sarcosine oxidase subunit gamma family protein [Paracoccaceae bacterium]|nr:sarcosine oxidase subunit gamma family protein [Paracoccaceae bacterium]